MRKNRLLVKGARYHVTARINRKEFILETKEIKTLFIKVTSEAKKKHSFSIESYTIMNNHFHFIIKPASDESLSRIMQWILSVFAIRYNRLMKLTGHVWGQRFYSKILESNHDFLAVKGYIDNNAVRACLVANAIEWEFCSLYEITIFRFHLTDPPG